MLMYGPGGIRRGQPGLFRFASCLSVIRTSDCSTETRYYSCLPVASLCLIIRRTLLADRSGGSEALTDGIVIVVASIV